MNTQASSRDIDLEDSLPTFQGIQETTESLLLAPSAPGAEEEPYYDYETASLHDVLGRLAEAVLLGEEDQTEALAAVAELKSGRAELKNSPNNSVNETRRQMKAKKAAIRLHLKYLSYSLKAYRKFCNHMAAGTATQGSEIKKIAIALIEVFKMSHNRIQAVLAMPLESSKAYTKSIGLRTGATNKFLQNNPSVTAGTTLGVGVLATAGLTFVIGPFSLIALALAIPTCATLLEKQSHSDVHTLRGLRQATRQLKSRNIRKPKDVARLQHTLNFAASANRAKIIPKYSAPVRSMELDREI